MRVAARWLSVIIRKPCSPGCPVLNVSIRPQQRWRFIFYHPTSHHSRAPPTIAKEDSSWLVGVRWARWFYKPLSPGVAISWSWWPHLQSLTYRFSFKWKRYLVIHIGWGTFYPNWLFLNVDMMKTWLSKLRDLWTTVHVHEEILCTKTQGKRKINSAFAESRLFFKYINDPFADLADVYNNYFKMSTIFIFIFLNVHCIKYKMIFALNKMSKSYFFILHKFWLFQRKFVDKILSCSRVYKIRTVAKKRQSLFFFRCCGCWVLMIRTHWPTLWTNTALECRPSNGWPGSLSFSRVWLAQRGNLFSTSSARLDCSLHYLFIAAHSCLIISI